MLWILGLIGGLSSGAAFWFFGLSQTESVWAKNLGRKENQRWTFFKRRHIRGLHLQLADFLDLMALGISSGLNMEKAWRLGVEHTPVGPLKSELDRVQASLVLGRPREAAFYELDQRLNQKSLHLFFALLAQSIRAGSRLQHLFHEQASSLRSKHLVRLERRAQTAPLRLLIPLFLFIFPTLFLVLFAPLFIRFSQGLSFF